MSQDIVHVGDAQLGQTRRDARAMTERALHMRALAYLAKAKSELLTETMLEVNHSRRVLRSVATRLDDDNAELRDEQQTLREHAALSLEQLMQADARLDEARRTHRLLSTAIAQSAEGVVITDAKGTIEYVNRSYVALSGYSEQELIGQNPRLLKSGAMDASVYAEMWATLTAGEVWAGRFVNRTKAGEIWHGDATLSPVRDEDGEITHHVGVIRDVSREVRLEEELRRAQKLDAIGQLAGGIAHDFNNTLTVVLASVDLAHAFLATLPDEIPGVEAELDTIAHCAKGAAALTRQLLVFSRRQTSVPEPVDLALATRSVERMLRRLLREDIELTLAADETIVAQIDPGHYEQVVVNLVVNARDALRRGGEIRVSVGPVELDDDYVGERVDVEPGAYACLTVTDDGEGMDAATAERIFEPFFTTKSEREGTGLGLATVHGIVHQAGGHVRVYSELGVGTTMRVYLPVVHAGLAVRAAAEPDRPERAARAASLLVCDDDILVRTKLVAALEEAGYRVRGAGSVADAKAQLAKDGALDLLLTDVIMPDASGPSLVTELRRGRPGLPVLLMSGHPVQTLESRGVEPEHSTFLQKPFRVATLLRKIASLLDT